MVKVDKASSGKSGRRERDQEGKRAGFRSGGARWDLTGTAMGTPGTKEDAGRFRARMGEWGTEVVA